jgi:alkaline phosphatase D
MVAIQAANPQLKFNNSQRGYVLCEVTPERWRTDFKVLDKVTVPDGSSARGRASPWRQATLGS